MGLAASAFRSIRFYADRASAFPSAYTMHQSQIDRTISAIKDGHTAITRTDASNHLAQLTSGIPPQSIDDNTPDPYGCPAG